MMRILEIAIAIALALVLAACRDRARPRGNAIDIIADEGVPAVAPATGAIAIAVGEDHACAIMTGGRVRCWGEHRGQLDGTEEQRTGHVTLPGIAGATRLALGRGFSCALDGRRQVQCWGRAENLGRDASRDEIHGPAPVAGLSDIVQIVAGIGFACALRSNGTVWCWGDNHSGALGDGSFEPRALPVQVAELRDVAAIAAGSLSACAITRAGGVMCWGGDPEAPAPRRVAGVERAMQLGMGASHACALADGEVRCWGHNGDGQLGDGTREDRSTPTRVAFPASTSIARIAVGGYNSCALDTTGAVWCWGSNNGGALAGIEVGFDEHHRARPARVPELVDVTSLSIGLWNGCALTTVGEVRCWGSALARDLGWDATLEPVDALMVDATQIAASARGTCAVRADRTVWCWGEWTFTDRPVAMPGLTNIVELAAGADHACARSTDDRVWCWGNSDNFGGRDFITAPEQVSSLRGSKVLALGRKATCGTDARGALRCIGGYEVWSKPEALAALGTNVRELVAGYGHACARRADGSVACWGDNHAGMVGDRSISETPRREPVGLPGVRDTRQLAAGQFHTCQVTGRGHVECWGNNGNGQLGIGAPLDEPVPQPTRVTGIEAANAIAADYDSTCALTEGEAWCWGDNTHGQLGDGTRDQRARPVAVRGVSEVTAIAVTSRHACALTRSGAVRCWGASIDGSLGDGRAWLARKVEL